MSTVTKEGIADQLQIIHDNINACRKCEPLVQNYRKPTSMYRGEVGKIVIVGQEPGNREIASQRAFSGPSGRRLNEWLIASGFNLLDPRRGVYTTSVAKCLCDDSGLALLRRNCIGFLDSQVRAVRPQLVISLGAVAYKAVRFGRGDL